MRSRVVLAGLVLSCMPKAGGEQGRNQTGRSSQQAPDFLEKKNIPHHEPDYIQRPSNLHNNWIGCYVRTRIQVTNPTRAQFELTNSKEDIPALIKGLPEEE